MKPKPRKMNLSEVSDWAALVESAGYQTGRLAANCGFSVRQLERHFLVCFGMPPSAWINQLRLARAKDQLTGGASIKAVAIDLGFKDSSHFYHKFKNRFGCTPGEFLKSLRVERVRP
jgi:AraC-like DNA-binding protein